MGWIGEDTILRCEDYLYIKLIFLFRQKVQEMLATPVQCTLVCEDRQSLAAELIKLHLLEDIETCKHAWQKAHIRNRNHSGMLKLLTCKKGRCKQ